MHTKSTLNTMLSSNESLMSRCPWSLLRWRSPFPVIGRWLPFSPAASCLLLPALACLLPPLLRSSIALFAWFTSMKKPTCSHRFHQKVPPTTIGNNYWSCGHIFLFLLLDIIHSPIHGYSIRGHVTNLVFIFKLAYEMWSQSFLMVVHESTSAMDIPTLFRWQWRESAHFWCGGGMCTPTTSSHGLIVSYGQPKLVNVKPEMPSIVPRWFLMSRKKSYFQHFILTNTNISLHPRGLLIITNIFLAKVVFKTFHPNLRTIHKQTSRLLVTLVVVYSNPRIEDEWRSFGAHLALPWAT